LFNVKKVGLNNFSVVTVVFITFKPKNLLPMILRLIFTTMLIAGAMTSVLAQQQDVYGCTDATAPNYNAAATVDDGTCCYSDWRIVNSSVPTNWLFIDMSDVGSTGTYYGASSNSGGQCIPTQGCYLFHIYPQDGISAFNFDITDADGNFLFSGESFDTYAQFYVSFTGEIIGCMSSDACNYNPAATCGVSAICDYYSCVGCTDPNAPNYNPSATTDDGSCCTGSYTIVCSATVEFYVWSNNFNYSVYGAYPETNSFCLGQGCYGINIFSIGGLPVDWQILDENGIEVYSGTAYESSASFTLDANGVTGCGNPQACNYDPSVTCSYENICTYDCYGCTDPNAPNYDATATVDDGTCCTNTWYTVEMDSPGSWYVYTYSGGNGYGHYPEDTGFCLGNVCFSLIVYSDVLDGGSFSINDAQGNLISEGSIDPQNGSGSIFLENGQSGCWDANACNYDPLSSCPDYTLCEYGCLGCTDPNAPNYNPDATIDNGTCCTGSWFTLQMDEPASWYVSTSASGGYSQGHYPEQNGFCIPEGSCFTVSIYSDFGFSVSFSVLNSDGVIVGEQTVDDIFGNDGWLFVENGSVAGCLDPYSCNYNPLATCADYSLCEYGCFGCTNPDAPNYNPDATVDNGTCCLNSWYTIELSAPAYWSASSTVDYEYAYGYYPEQNGFCMSDGGCFAFSAFSFDGMSDITYNIYDQYGDLAFTGQIEPYGVGAYLLGEDEISGCTDFNACNYNPEATCADWTICDYSCYGCTDPTAPNFDPTATLNDGQCCYSGWYNMSGQGEYYWYTSTGGSGYYPYQTGFCGGTACFSVYIYSVMGTPGVASVTDPDGNNAGEIYFGGYDYTILSVGLNGEIPGCTYPESCNYNADATCDDGSCQYYCGGCMDESALNYDPYAQYDDGSCFYEIEPPLMGMAVIPDETNNQYYVQMNMMALGNGAPYMVSQNYSNELMMIDENGMYMAGPYPCNQEVVISLQSMTADMSTYMESDPISIECSTVLSTTNLEEEANTLTVYPNPANGVFNITGINAERAQIQLIDLTGRKVFDKNVTVGAGRFEMNSSSLESGVYRLLITSAKGTQSSSVVIEK
jgi:Secretion system C-terminal sorting domain